MTYLKSPEIRKIRHEDVRRSLGAGASALDVALEQLCQLHWSSLYGFARQSGCSHVDAEDAVQEFFADLIGRRKYSLYDAQRGNLRAFLTAALRNFLIDRLRKKTAQKRGGRAIHVSFEMSGERNLVPRAEGQEEVELAIDRKWAAAVMARARQRLAEYFYKRDKAELYEIIGSFLLAGVDSGDYDRAGEILGMTEPAIRNAVFRMRRRFRDLLIDEIDSSSKDGEGASEHVRYLMYLLLAKDS